MDLTAATLEKMTLATFAITALVILWRAFVAGLAKRDADRAEVVAAYKLTADKTEEWAEKAIKVIEADTAAITKLTEEVARLRADLKSGGR
jgi:hypothetical protein